MRADRLVAVVLLLQRRGKVTAADLASELEVSERTARRDLEALAMAGVPVVSTVGRGGGWALVGGARTDLSGLTDAEARALFAAAGPAVASTPELRAALRKLVAALPEPFRDAAERAGRSVVVDPSGWGSGPPADGTGPAAGDHLDAVQLALFGRHRLDLSYRDRRGTATVRTVDPYGLVAKEGRWYLVADTDRGRRTFRLDRVAAAVERDEPASVPDDFDLRAAWAEIATDVDRLRSPAAVEVVADASLVDPVRWVFAGRVQIVGPEGGRTRMVVRGQSVDLVARQLAGFGDGVEVLGPPEARERLGSLGAELSDRYATATPRPGSDDALP